jgi:hypothetical protein
MRMIQNGRNRCDLAPDDLPDWPEPISGGKYLRMLDKHVRALREESPHGNRQLFLDDVFLAHLLALFNPTLRSLRTIEDFSQTRQAQRHLSVRKLCKSTLSDFHRMADPALLEPLIAELRAAVAARGGQAPPADLPHRLGQVLAVDGSFFRIAADVAWAVQRATSQGRKKAGARLDLHLNIGTWMPEIVQISGGDTSEAEAAARAITPGAVHLYDRGIFSFELLRKQIEVGAFFVHRLREPGERTPKFAAETPRELTEADRAAGVQSDALGRLVGSTHRPPPEGELREVVIQASDEPGGQVRLLTNLFDVDARIVGQLYRYRWQVELFFRWLKCFAHFAHLISTSREGVLLSFYVAVIGVMLMYLQTGARPSKYAFSLLGLAACGAATLEELAPILKERERRIALDRASAARRRAKKKLEGK